jgi:hypothetical protein
LEPAGILSVIALAIRGMCRAYGAAFRLTNQKLLITRCQMLSRELPLENYKSTATKPERRNQTARPEALETRQNVAQPVRAGNGGDWNPEHRRCGT